MGTLVRMLPAAFVVATFGHVASAQPAGWTHRGGVQVLEKSGTTLTDHQVLVTIDTETLIANGQMNVDGSDLRFYSDCAYTTSLPYWIESGLGTAATKVWVRVPSLPANATTQVYFAHGNAAAISESALASVFDGVGGVPGTAISATHQVTGTNSTALGNSQRGFRFEANTDLLVVQVGKYEPNGSTRYITIFDFETEAKLLQTQVSGPAAQYTYGDLAQPLWLAKGHQYLLEMYQGASESYFWVANPQVDPAITFLDMRFCNDCSPDTFPRQSLGGSHFGYPDLMFFTRKEASVPPEQTSVSCEATATCNSDCSVATCGDGVLNPEANEECDDGNDVDTDACRNDCMNAICGDGVVQAGVEECDDGNQASGDGCSPVCKKEGGGADAGAGADAGTIAPPDAGDDAVDAGAGLAFDGDGDGCSCRSTGAHSSFGPAVSGLVLAAAAARFRRRRRS